MDTIIITYAAQGIYTLALLACGYLWRGLKSARNDNMLIKDGVRALLRDRLIHKCEKCIEGGYCTTEYHDSIMEMYYDYKALGGNGVVQKLIGQINQLPITKPEKDNG